MKSHIVAEVHVRITFDDGRFLDRTYPYPKTFSLDQSNDLLVNPDNATSTVVITIKSDLK